MKSLGQAIAIICIYVLFSACAATSGKESLSKSQETSPIPPILKAALDSAKKQGNTVVNIQLNESPGLVQANDIVTVKFKAVLDTGKLLAQADELQIVAGRPEAVPGLGTAVLGMAVDKKQIRVTAKKAFGEKSKEKEQHLPRIQSMPVKMALGKAGYERQFKKIPKPGDRIQVNPYFESQVTEVTEDKIIVSNLAQDGAVDKAPFGETLTTVKDGTISLRLTPVIGAAFPLGDHEGRIISFDETTFVVDLNHPLAGHAIDLDLEVTSIVKASQAAQKQISWVDDYDQGVAAAMTEKKDMVLVLYAPSCPWCKKLLSQTFEDPRIRLLNDRFVFVKANSQTEPDLKEIFEQDGYPMMVFTDPRGRVIKKMEGFKSASQLLTEFELLLKTDPQT